MYSYGHNYYKNAEHSDFGIENHTMCLHGTYYVCHCPTTLQEGSVIVVVSVRVAREDCGACLYCRDKLKFGGPNTKRRCCVQRRCLTGSKVRNNRNNCYNCTCLIMTWFVIFTQVALSKYLPILPVQSLENALLTQGRKLRSITRNGNCLFRALAFILCGSEGDHKKMTLLLVKFLEQNTQLFQPLLMADHSLQDHIRRMHRLKEWGTQVELQAAASLFQKELYVFTQLPASTQYDWIQYEPHSPDKLNFVDANLCRAIYIPHLELCHRERCHFECIINDKNSFPFDCPNLPGSVSHVVL